MTLLFDENLSYRLVAILQDLFPGSLHVHSSGLGSAMDETIWEFARDNGLTIVTKDSDFHERSVVEGYPPKIIWITRGNCSTDQIAHLLRANSARIADLHSDPVAAFLVVR